MQQDRLQKCSLASSDRIELITQRTKVDTMMTSERLKAQGKSIMRPVLTGESSYEKVDTHWLGAITCHPNATVAVRP